MRCDHDDRRPVLVLTELEPMSVCSVRRAIVLQLWEGRSRETYDGQRVGRQFVVAVVVVRLSWYVNVPYKRILLTAKHHPARRPCLPILRRFRGEMTVDHVIPSVGRADSWRIWSVPAPLQQSEGDRPPEEVG